MFRHKRQCRRKAKRGKKLRYGRYLVMLVLIAAIVSITNPLEKFKSLSYFQIKRIDISGVRNVTISDVQARLKVREGENIFFIDARETVKLLVENPWIKDVSIRMLLPDTLKINIIEREPVGFVGRSKVFVFDEDGIILKNSRKLEYFMPHMLGVSVKGKRVPETLLRSYLELVKVARSVDLETPLGELDDWFVLHEKGNLLLRVGQYRFSLGESSYSSKMLRFLQVHDMLEEKFIQNDREVVNIDLRFDKRVILRDVV